MTASVAFEGNSNILAGWDAFTISDSFVDPLGLCEFTTHYHPSRSFEYRELLAKGEAIQVAVEGASQGKWIITERTPRIDENGVTTRIRARSMLAAAYEGAVDPALNFSSQTDAEVGEIVLRAFKPYGFTTIELDSTPTIAAYAGKTPKGRKVPASATGLKASELKANDGETVYQFAARIYTRLGLCLRTDLGGKLLLAAPDYDQSALYSLHQTFAGSVEGSDRMLNGIEVTDSNEGQFSECVCRGSAPDKKGATQTSRPGARVIGAGSVADRPSSAPFGTIAATELPEARHRYRSPSTAAPYKPMIMTDKSSRDNKRCASTAQLAMGLRARSGYVVQCDVPGFRAKTGALWTVDTIARVRIDAEALDEDMWILERTFEMSRARGMITKLTLIPKGALVLGEIPS